PGATQHERSYMSSGNGRHEGRPRAPARRAAYYALLSRFRRTGHSSPECPAHTWCHPGCPARLPNGRAPRSFTRLTRVPCVDLLECPRESRPGDVARLRSRFPHRSVVTLAVPKPRPSACALIRERAAAFARSGRSPNGLPQQGSWAVGRRLFVGNLSYQTDEQELTTLFSQYGSVESAQVIRD